MKKNSFLVRNFPLIAAFFLSGSDMSISRISDIGGFKGNPEYHPRRKKFKGYQREQHLGRRRSKYYFNKNR